MAGKKPGLLALLLFPAVCSGCEREAPPSAARTAQETLPEKTHEGVIVALGDSLTAGFGVPESAAYPARLEAKLRADGYSFQVINAGISGETSSGALARLDWTLKLKPDIVIVETGANDGLRGLDVAVLETNLDRLLTRLRAEGVVVVLAGMRMARNLGVAYTEAFDAVYPRLAQKHDVIFMPFFLKGVATRRHLNQADGIHPTRKGYAVLVDNLYPYVLKAIEVWRSSF